jgi:glycosyltransferase involved in cell wall biosynthesis
VSAPPRSPRESPPTAPLRVATTAERLSPVGGVELCMLQDTSALVARGHHVDVLFHDDGPQRAEYAALGVPPAGPYRFDVDRSSVVRDLRAFLPSLARLRRLAPEVLWLNRPEQIVWAQLASRWARVPIVCHLHHAPNFHRTRLLMTGVAHFVAVSEFMKTLWVAAGVEPERITVVHNAVPADEYPAGGAAELESARRDLDLGIAPGARVVLSYGRLSVAKGVLTLVEAWRDLGLSPDRAVLVLAGPEPVEPEVLEALSQLPEGSHRLLGTRRDVVPLLHAADVVVMASQLPEAFGRVLIEAMSTGRPAIGTDVGAVPEVLAGEFAGLLVRSGDRADLAARIASLLDWRRDDPGLGERCRRRVDEVFPYARHVDGLEAVLVAHARRRAPRRRPTGRRRVGVSQPS